MNPSTNTVDLVIVGGGIAGLWLANVFADRGYRLILLEGDTLGCGQTLASQGMVHGGIKYGLDGVWNRAAMAISTMPARWRECLAGYGAPDLRELKPRSERYYLFAQDGTLDRLRSFFASRVLRGRVAKLNVTDYPLAFQDPGFHGVVYAVDDLVIDPRALLRVLQAPVADRTYHHQLVSGEVAVTSDGVAVQLGNGHVQARHLLLCAGAGNDALVQGLGLAEPQMQLRPLHQVLVHHDYPHPLFAHCLTGTRQAEPRLTITSHRTANGPLWYLGGQIASDGVNMAADELAAHAMDELRACLPWLRWDNARIDTLRIDRAEPFDPAGKRPDAAFARADGPVVTCWPTKLSLAPDLADQVQALLQPPANIPTRTSNPTLALPGAALGHAPWER